MAREAGQRQRLWRSSRLGQQTWDRHRQQQTAGKRSSRKASATEGTRHEGGVEPLALSCSTDLKSAPRTDEDHHGQLRGRLAAAAGQLGMDVGRQESRHASRPCVVMASVSLVLYAHATHAAAGP